MTDSRPSSPRVQITREETWFKVCSLQEFKNYGEKMLLNTDSPSLRPGKQLQVFIVKPKDNAPIYAIQALCPHAGGPLECGDIEDLDGETCTVCPWHKLDFSLKTGRMKKKLHPYKAFTWQVKVEDDLLYIKMLVNTVILSHEAVPPS